MLAAVLAVLSLVAPAASESSAVQSSGGPSSSAVGGSSAVQPQGGPSVSEGKVVRRSDGCREIKNIQYVEDGDAYRLERCRLDLCIPEKPGFKTVVWFHGGGLTSGGKHFIPLVDKSIAQVAVNYRLMSAENGLAGADLIRDAAAAVAWTLKHIAEYGGDPKQVYVSGMSAGGYLTMMVGMAPEYLAEHGFKPTDLAGLAPVSGQATKHFAVRAMSGDKDPQFAPKIDALAPLAHCSADLPPIVSICGQPPYEWKCRAEENRLLIASCTALGHKRARYVELPLCDHGRAYSCAIPYVELFILGWLP